MDGGEWTINLGKRIEVRLRGFNDPNLRVFFDYHTVGTEDGRKNDRIVSRMSVDGLKGRATWLSFLDLAVTYRGEALVLCEVEEGHSTPKKIIGDTCNLLYADFIKVGRSRFGLNNYQFFYGLAYQDGGQGSIRAEEMQRRITAPIRKDALDRMRIEIVAAPSCEEMIAKLEDKIIGEVGRRLSQ